jgi:hypothetical protein
MFLSVNVLGTSVLTTAIPPAKLFNSVEFSGECVLDNVHAQGVELIDEQIEEIVDKQTWSFSTIFLSDFEDKLDSGNIQNADKPIEKWRIKRKKASDPLYILLAEQDFDETSATYTDRTPKNEVEYDYAVHPVAEDGTEGNPTEGVEFVSFYGWILSDDTTTYTFDIEIETETVETVDDFKEYENFTEYNVVSFGQRLFDRGGIRTIPGTINGFTFEQNADFLDTLKAFINNKGIKTLRNSKGKIWQVVTRGYSEKYMDKIAEQPVTVSFNWQQIGAGEQ